MKSIERFLVTLDSEPWSAIFRVALGLGLPPMFHALFGNRDSVWISLSLLIGVLLLLRVATALLRRALPFSPKALEAWAERRNVAKQFDSYQWQKLFWIGLGIVFYAMIADGPRNSELIIAAICLVCGSVGLFFWHRVRPARPAN